jgi:hypothetical protein
VKNAVDKPMINANVPSMDKRSCHKPMFLITVEINQHNRDLNSLLQQVNSED